MIPFIDQPYRTIPGDRTIVGHSIGGFFGSYVLFQHPQLFAKYLIVSPSLRYTNDMIFQYEAEFARTHKALKGDTIPLNKGFGFANFEWNAPNTPDTKFNIGFVSKQFTTVMVLQLAQEGKGNRLRGSPSGSRNRAD